MAPEKSRKVLGEFIAVFLSSKEVTKSIFLFSFGLLFSRLIGYQLL